MSVDRVKFQNIVASQLPTYVKEDFPLLVQFLEQYYISQEFQGSTLDILQNMDQYVKVEELTNLSTHTILESKISLTSTTIKTSFEGNFTDGFVDNDGLIMIDDEIIYYKYKTDTTFEGCIRGFSGVTSYQKSNSPDELVFKESRAANHNANSTIHNLNTLFLQIFLKKVKGQFAPGYDERPLAPNLNQKNFIYNVDSFYKSKGTDTSFKILFGALYGENVDVIRPSQFLIRPSNADYKVTQDFVVEQVQGDVLDLKNRTLYQNTTGARGSVSDVEQINYDQGQYYKISIDFGYQRDIDVDGTIFGKFKPNPSTQLLNNVSTGSSIVDVDSTLSFPNTGSVVTTDIDNDRVIFSYTGKSVNQFLGVSGITNTLVSGVDVNLNEFSFAQVSETNQIKVRVLSTLQDLQLPETTRYLTGDKIYINNFGYEGSDQRLKNWTYNVKSKFNVEKITLVDLTENKYIVQTYDTNSFKTGYKLLLENFKGNFSSLGNILSINSSTEFVMKVPAFVNVSDTFSVENQTLKANSSDYLGLNDYIANVQNTYFDFNSALVATNSLPNYYNIQTNPYNKKVVLNGFYNGQVISSTKHGFYSGDAIYYQPRVTTVEVTNPDGIVEIEESVSKFDDLKEGVYYVKRISRDQFSISRSKGDLFANKFLNVNGTVVDNQFIYFNFYNKVLSPQQLYRIISPPVQESKNYNTDPGYVGIFNNGVELLNYKSYDVVYYGDIEKLNVTSSGFNYDIITPPEVMINDEVGTGATGTASVTGSLERIEIVEPGFDYQDIPIVKISGGNGKDASAEANMLSTIHIVNFNAEQPSGIVSTTDNTLGFTTFHKFRNGEKVVYDSRNLKVIGGIGTNNFYYVGVVDPSTIKLHVKESDALSGINTSSLTSFGSGLQSIKSSETRNIVSSIIINNRGYGYSNKKREIPVSGVSTALNQIYILNHGYESKEIVQYTSGTTPVQGISTTKDYYVVKVDDSNFSLTEIGVGNTSTDYFYNENILVDITSEGSGSFNYQPIKVSVDGIIGVHTTTGQDFRCKVQPIFRGSIDSVDLTNNGVGYGASEIMNFDRQPNISFLSGTGSQLAAIINNGSIVDVLVVYGGKGYNSPPDLVIESEKGTGAVLTPIVRNGVVAEVKVIKGGAGYVQNKTKVLVRSAGREAKVNASIKTWSVNLFERDFENIKSDDGFVNESLDDQSLEYSHMYAARVLRESSYVIAGTGGDNILYGISDLIKIGNNETDSKYHSPILGWAYDGNPIYGPYGFSNIDGTGQIRRMVSGYENQTTNINRPQFETGFFVEDYVFTGRGDLDEHNGRYCVTPDYPNGVYAYFVTINNTVDSSGPFNDYRRPVFPYVVGNSYESTPNPLNFAKRSNQTDLDLQGNTWLRYTPPYHINDRESEYDYIFNSNKIKRQIIDVTYATTGGVSSVGITSGGDGYKVRDTIIFDREGSNSRTNAQVSRIGGKSVDTISVATTSISNVEFVPSSNIFVGITSLPHNLSESNRIQVSGISSYYAGFEGSYSVGVSSSQLTLISGISSTPVTGLVTFIPVSGNLDISTNDILVIESEKVKVLNVDKDNSRIRVLREFGGTVGSAHTNFTKIFSDSRRFSINVGTIKTTREFQSNKQIYFIPDESVGVGTIVGTGIGNTLNISNPGAGVTQVYVLPTQIKFTNHGFKLNELLDYSTNGGTSIQVWGGDSNIGYQNLNDIQDLYAVPVTPNTFSVAQNKVGLGSTGTYVGVGTGSGLLYFTSVGVGDTHSFKTKRDNVLLGEIDQNIVTVSLASTHNLRVRDRVFVDVEPRDAIDVVVKYNDYNRRIVFNPKTFISSGINTVLNTIQITEGDFNFGDKVIHNSTSPTGDLVDEGMYYVVPYNKNSIRLVRNESDLLKENPDFVKFPTTGSGTLSKINPSVDGTRGNSIRFDLSDPSLAFVYNGVSYSAFEMGLYSDPQYLNSFLATSDSSEFEVKLGGKVGIDTGAFLSYTLSDFVPQTVYYKFNQPNFDFNPDFKNVVIDEDVKNYQQLNVIPTPYNGLNRVTGTGTTTFTYDLSVKPLVTVYNKDNSDPTYETDSFTEVGGITKISVTNPGSGYKTIPGITSVRSGAGNSAILLADTEDIGKIKSWRFNDIGFKYPTDNTLRVTANPPEIIKVESLYSIDRIGITSAGRGYLVPAELIFIDGFTNKVVPEVDLEYTLGDNQVTILRNVFNLYNTEPKIVPTQNSNGVPIKDASYNINTNIVRIVIDKEYQIEDVFPFSIGDQVMVENISVGVGTTGIGYNSRDYGYKFFRVNGIDKKAGGSGAYVEYSMKDILKNGEIPGNMDPSRSFGRIIPRDDLITFETTLKQNELLIGETVNSRDNANTGIIERWDPNSGYLYISSIDDFEIGEVIVGQSSGTFVTVEDKIDYYTEIKTGAGATVVHGWQSNSGVMNDDQQRIPNNEYYQNFSYSLKSSIPYSTWSDPVGALDHTAGFEKFADLNIVSSSNEFRESVSPIEGGVELTIDLISSASVNCYYDFDTATETVIEIGETIISKEVNLDNVRLTDYFESVGNRVLEIDDISPQFDSNSRPTPFTAVSEYPLGYRFNKIFTFVKDTVFTDEVQASMVSLLQVNNIGYMHEYGTIDSKVELGTFDYLVPTVNPDLEFQLTFFPVKSEYNNYDISTLNFATLDANTSTGSTTLGTVVRVGSERDTIISSTRTEVLRVPTSYRSSKCTVLIDDGTDYSATEFVLVHDGTDVYVSEYGKVQNTDSQISVGFGTFVAYIDGTDVKLDFDRDPSVSSDLTSNSSTISISNTASTGIGTITLTTSELSSFYTNITSSGSPVANTIASYTEPDETSYFFVSVEDTTNNEYEAFEVIVLSSSIGETFVEWGNLYTGSTGIGTIGVSKSSGTTNLEYTPKANANVQVRVYGNTLRLYDDNTRSNVIFFGNKELKSDEGIYTGTLVDLKTTFDLTHKGTPIFQREFDASDSNIVSVTDNSIIIPNHFFVTGEKVSYNATGIGSTSSISITSTNIPGLGVTDKLPSSVFVVKDGDLKIKFASSAADALLEDPNVLEFTSVGVGTIHKITSINQNPKVMLAIDNMIQTPIVSAGVTALLTNNIIFDTRFEISGVTSIRSDDLIKLDDEIMLVTDVGIGGQNFVSVRRAWMGSSIKSHGSNSLVTKIQGNYNIIDNTLNFSQAPYGLTPLSTTVNGPYNVDWSGIGTSSTFQGRMFMRSGLENGSEETYSKNYVFDDISNDFTGVQSSFTLKSNGSNITGVAPNNTSVILVNGIYQEPNGIQNDLIQKGDYTLDESGGSTTISFSGSDTQPEGYDPNKTDLPLGGLIVSVASTEGFGYQPLVSAGATVTVGSGGTITSVSIGNSGSGYRSGVQPTVSVGVQTYSGGVPNIHIIGSGTVSGGHVVSIAITNPGTGYTSTNPPEVVIEAPLAYTDIPLQYSSDSVVGGGISATADIVVGQGSSVIDFRVVDQGFGYGNDEILTVAIGGTVGIPTTGTNFEEFQLTVEQIFSDSFSGWSVGSFQVLDSISDKFNGTTKLFELQLNRERFSAQSSPGSNVDINQTILVFINDILQKPGVSYKLKGGSFVEFTEAPTEGDSSKILFYQGSGLGVDVVFKDILQTIKPGDSVELHNDPTKGQGIEFDQLPRVVVGIATIDTLTTTPYSTPNPGIVTDSTLTRPVEWCKQMVDRVIDGDSIGKDRPEYEPSVYPSSFLLQSVGIGSTVVYVDTLRPLFNASDEAFASTVDFQNSIVLTSQDVVVGASATAIVSSAGTVTSVVVGENGKGYYFVPSVSFSSPVGLNTTSRASGTVNVANGSVTTISVDSPGTGYTSSNPPIVLIEEPSITRKEMNVQSYSGDYGIIVGFGTTTISSQNQVILDFFLPQDSFMRDSDYVGVAITVSGISTGDFFTLDGTNVGVGTLGTLETKRNNGSDLGITTQFFDCTYQVSSTYLLETEVIGVGNTTIRRVFANVGPISTISFSQGTNIITFDSTEYTFDSNTFDVYNGGISSSRNFGHFSWGKIVLTTQIRGTSFNSYNNDGVIGLSTSTLITRKNPLKFNNYPLT